MEEHCDPEVSHCQAYQLPPHSFTSSYNFINIKPMKKIILIFVIIGVIGLSVFFVATREVELQEESPLDQPTVEEPSEDQPFEDITQDEMRPELKDALEKMAEEDANKFMEEMKIAREIVMEMEEEMPKAAELIAQGLFQAHAHEVEGEALLISEGEKITLRFENFDTINGPNLHIYLSADQGISDAIDLGKIRATTGNVNYEVPEGTDTEKYKYVLVWCQPFHILFSSAELR